APGQNDSRTDCSNIRNIRFKTRSSKKINVESRASAHPQGQSCNAHPAEQGFPVRVRLKNPLERFYHSLNKQCKRDKERHIIHDLFPPQTNLLAFVAPHEPGDQCYWLHVS